MAKTAAIGITPCPECGFDQAEVKRQKTPKLVYRWCPECNAQYFCRTPEASKRLLKKIGIEEAGEEKKPVEPVKPVEILAPSPKAKEKIRPSMADTLAFFTGK